MRSTGAARSSGFDLQTGAQTVISQDGFFQEPVGEALAPDGSLLVADADAVDGNGALSASI